MSAHAILSPSSAARWLACTPSARLEEKFPDSSGDYAEEGTLAHAFGENVLRYLNGEIDTFAHTGTVKTLSEHRLYTPELQKYAEDYAHVVWEKYQTAKKDNPDAILRIEEQIDLTAYAPESFGTGDAVILAGDTIEIIDLKYGKGVPVSAVDNKQMMLYALGAYDMFGFMYEIEHVRMTIYQPRLDNLSESEMPIADLLAWGENELKPLAQKAFRGEGEFKAGSHCRFCRAKVRCKAFASYNLDLARFDFLDAELLSESEIAEVLAKADVFKNWLSAVEEYALKTALDGTRFPGYKLVEGRSVRKYSNEAKVAETLVKNGFKEEQIYDRKLKTITAMEKVITKKTFGALLDALVIKPEGKPTLVPDSDSRPEYNSAQKDFENVQI